MIHRREFFRLVRRATATAASLFASAKLLGAAVEDAWTKPGA